MLIFFFTQKTAYELRISDWSSDVCSSDLEIEPLAESDRCFRPAKSGQLARPCEVLHLYAELRIHPEARLSHPSLGGFDPRLRCDDGWRTRGSFLQCLLERQCCR